MLKLGLSEMGYLKMRWFITYHVLGGMLHFQTDPNDVLLTFVGYIPFKSLKHNRCITTT